jgi:hypothetical protein
VLATALALLVLSDVITILPFPRPEQRFTILRIAAFLREALIE